MANNFKLTTGLEYKDAAGATRFQVPSKSIDQSITSQLMVHAVQNIGTTEEALDLGTLTGDGGPGYLHNLDAANYVEIGLMVAATFVPFLKIPAGCRQPIVGFADSAVYAKANTAAINLEYLISEA